MERQETGRRKRNQLSMLRAVSRFEKSGLTRSEFAKSLGITVSKLEYWRTRCRALSDDAAVGPKEPPREASPEATLVPLSIVLGGTVNGSGRGQFEVVLTNGRRLLVPEDFASEALRRLLEVVEC